MSLSLGQQLKTARIDRNLTLEDVFKNTHIRIKYLEALEDDDFSIMPSPVQGRGFLRLYANFLGLDAKAMLAELQHQELVSSEFSKIEETFGEVPRVIERKEDPLLQADSGETKSSFWKQFLARIGVSFTSPEVDPLEGMVAPPIVEPTTTSVTEAEPEPKAPSRTPEDMQLEPSQAPEKSRILFMKIGAALRERREMLSLTHAEIEGHIHLRPRYMEALEAGKFEVLPSPVQTRGMLTNYAEFLDLDSEELLLQFAEGLQAQRSERNIDVSSDRRRQKRRFSFGNFIAPDLIFGVSVVVLFIAFSVWGLGRIANTHAEEALPEATAPSIAEVLMSTPTPEFILTPTQTLVVVSTPNGDGTPVALDESITEDTNLGVQILVTILERSWMRVTVDREVVFEGRAQADATFVYEGVESVEILTANGAGVRIAYNQQDQGLMGGLGEIVQRIYGPFGLLTPTVTPTSLATLTPTPTITPSLTPTLVVTPLE